MGIVILFSLSLLVTFYKYEIQIEEKEIITEFLKVRKSLSSKVSNITDLTNATSEIAENYYQYFENNQIQPHFIFKYLSYDANKKGFHLDKLPEHFKKEKFGSLTLLGDKQSLTKKKMTEINMALALTDVFRLIINHITDSPWIYYTSNDFVYITPFIPSNEFFFSKTMVEEKEFYKNAKPEFNPNRKAFWTRAYIDEAGKGVMTTYSVPIYNQNYFLGTISIDITTDQFNTILKSFQNTTGELFIFNNKHQLIAAPKWISSKDLKIKKLNDFIDQNTVSEILALNTNTHYLLPGEGSYLLKFDIPELQMFLVYKVDQFSFWLRVINKTKLFLILFVFGILLIFRNFRNLIKISNQQKALVKSQYLMNESQKIANLCSWEFDSTTNEFILSKNGKVFFPNESLTNKIKLTEIIEFVSPDYQREWQNKISQCISFHKQIRFESPTNPQSPFLNNHIKYISIFLHIEPKLADQYILRGTFQDITERKELEKNLEIERAKMVHTSKLAALGEMSAGIAHEINNPLAIIAANANQVKKIASELKFDSAINHIVTIENMIKRITKIIKGLRNFARESDNDPIQKYSVAILLDDILGICSERLKVNSIELIIANHLDPDQSIECNPTQISQVLLNLISNSFDSIKEAEERWLKIEIRKVTQYIVFEIIDSGKGINPDVADKIFQPFFTTKEVGRGTGIGLSISKGLIEAHRGKIYLDINSENTKFIIELPIIQPQSSTLDF